MSGGASPVVFQETSGLLGHLVVGRNRYRTSALKHENSQILFQNLFFGVIVRNDESILFRGLTLLLGCFQLPGLPDELFNCLYQFQIFSSFSSPPS